MRLQIVLQHIGEVHSCLLASVILSELLSIFMITCFPLPLAAFSYLIYSSLGMMCLHVVILGGCRAPWMFKLLDPSHPASFGLLSTTLYTPLNYPSSGILICCVFSPRLITAHTSMFKFYFRCMLYLALLPMLSLPTLPCLPTPAISALPYPRLLSLPCLAPHSPLPTPTVLALGM